MKLLFFDAHSFEREYYDKIADLDVTFTEVRLLKESAGLASGYEAVCCFVNDKLNREILTQLKESGVKYILLRCAGFNNLDQDAAKDLGLAVARVPEYSPYAVAEHAVALILSLNRKIHRAYWRVREQNFSLKGLVGFDLHGKTIGIVGTGKIGKCFGQIMQGFGCQLLLFDPNEDKAWAGSVGGRYVTKDELFRNSDIISLHAPLNSQTKYFINKECLATTKKGVMIINTGRGGLIDTQALVQAIKTGQVGAAGLDVYEEEENFFFEDHSEEILTDETLARLMTFPNVLITSHQAFLTKEALTNIAATTLKNLELMKKGEKNENFLA